MNKRLYFKVCSIAIGSFLAVWVVSFGIFMLNARRLSKVPTPGQATEIAQGSVQSAEFTHYIARLRGNDVVVYEVYANGYEKAVLLPDIAVAQLPEGDRQNFKKGIILKTRGELASLLEDFTS